MLIAYLLFGVVVVGTCVLVWAILYSWFAENRAQNDMYYAGSRSVSSWNTDHEFFDMITEFRDDFVS